MQSSMISKYLTIPLSLPVKPAHYKKKKKEKKSKLIGNCPYF